MKEIDGAEFISLKTGSCVRCLNKDAVLWCGHVVACAHEAGTFGGLININVTAGWCEDHRNDHNQLPAGGRYGVYKQAMGLREIPYE